MKVRWGHVAEIAAWLGAVGLATLAAAHVLVRADAVWAVILHSATDWLFMPAWVLLGIALLARWWRVAVVAGGVCALHAGWVLPGNLWASDPGVGAPLRVVSANLAKTESDPATVRALAALSPDVLVLQEYTTRWEALFADAPELSGLVYRVERAAPPDNGFGIALYSRLPLRDAEVRDLVGTPMIEVVVDTQAPVTILGVHTMPPVRTELIVRRGEQVRALARWMDEHARFVVAGDLNASRHDPVLAPLWTRARSAHALCGRGGARTWPVGRGILPPYLGLDHVLVSDGIGCAAIAEGPAGVSDHLPVVADLVVAP